MKCIRIFLFVLIIIGIGLLVTQKMWVPKVVDYVLTHENATGSSDEIIQTGYKVDYNYVNQADGSVKLQQLVFVSPGGNRMVIPNDIATKIDESMLFELTGQRNGETINAGLMPVNPNEKDGVVFSTRSLTCEDTTQCTTVNKVYSYNFIQNNLKLLYTAPKITSEGDGVELVFAGIQKTKVIFVKHTIGTDGTCSGTFWTQNPKDYSYLDLNNISAGLISYVVPKEKIQEGITEEKNCDRE